MIFGVRLPDCRYVVRPSAYAIVQDGDGRIATARVPGKGWFLPGGGVEANETPFDAVEREAKEECGLLVRADRVVGEATDIVHSPAGHSGVDKRSVFVEAVVVGETARTEADHELVWLAPDEAAHCLSHASHRWAVRIRLTTE